MGAWFIIRIIEFSIIIFLLICLTKYQTKKITCCVQLIRNDGLLCYFHVCICNIKHILSGHNKHCGAFSINVKMLTIFELYVCLSVKKFDIKICNSA